MCEKNKLREMLFEVELARRAYMHPIWYSMGLIAGQPRLLSKLWEKDRITQKELSEAAGIDPATLSRALDRLEDMGLIIRQGHPHSRRAVLISLTEDGRKKADEVRQAFQGLEDRMLKGISEEERAAMTGILKKIYQNLKSLRA